MKISVVGAGNLGRALIEALLSSGLVTPSELEVFERDSASSFSKSDSAESKFGGQIRGPRCNDEPVSPSDVIIIAVKPQDAHSTLEVWSGGLKPETVVISVMAGISTARIQSLLGGHRAVARAMPNLGAAFRKSATAFYCDPLLSTTLVESVTSVIETFGMAWRVDKENLVDAATAIAGSGPAYFFWLAERMILTATELGFQEDVAWEIVVQTLQGVGEYLDHTHLHPAVARQKVTSPNGTTAAAFAVMNGSAVDETISKAIYAAFERASQLSK